MQKLSREFVTVAEEVHFLYPENEWALNRLKDDPAHQLFKKFGESMPDDDWNHPGTKQGVYMIGPHGEYLEGGGAISGNAKVVTERLKGALARWKKLRKKAKYANRKVPRATDVAPPKVDDKPLAFRVFLRDLPRGDGDDSGRRVEDKDKRGRMWLAFTEWAWNQNWIGFDDPRAFVTESSEAQPVDDAIVQRICRDVLVDNVRGQTPRWKKEHVREAALTVQRIGADNDRWILEYHGHAEMKSGAQHFAPKLFGRAVWNAENATFESFDLVAIGTRSGKGVFNQRGRDQEPAPMGIAFGLHRSE